MKKEKKSKAKRIILFIIIILILSIIIRCLLSINTKNIVILNNNYYSDEDIIEAGKLENYPKFILLNKSKVKKNISSLDLIKDVKIKKKWGYILEITISEDKLLYYIRSKEEYMASNYKTYKLNNVNGVPTLLNFVPESVEKDFVKRFSRIDNSIITLISEIEYSKTEYDEKRFLLYMSDGNEVYVTVSKLDVLNKYVDIVKKLNNKNGILYLDSGNYFKIKE